MKSSFFPCLATMVALSSLSSAAIVLSGNFQTGSPTPTLTITQDIVFTMQTTGNSVLLIFDEWVTSDGQQDGITPTPASLLYQVNSGSTVSVPFTAFRDNYNTASGSRTANDSYIAFNGNLSASAGDTVTIKAQSFTFTSAPGFNSNIASNSEGKVFLASSAARLSDIVTVPIIVPEPSMAMLGAIGLIGLLRRRR